MVVRWAIAASAAYLLAATAAAAMDVKPISFDLTPSGRGATEVVRITNPGSRAIAVEVLAQARSVTETGEDVFSDDGGDIAIFPPQTVVAPKSAASVRVRYVGPRDIARSRDYVVFFNQVPLDGGEAQTSGVKLVFSFGAAVHVSPVGARPDLMVEAVRHKGAEVELVILNQGAKYARLGEDDLFVRCGSASVAIPDRDIASAARAPLVLPGARRVVKLATPAACKGASAIHASFDARD